MNGLTRGEVEQLRELKRVAETDPLKAKRLTIIWLNADKQRRPIRNMAARAIRGAFSNFPEAKRAKQ